MYSIEATSLNEAFAKGLRLLLDNGKAEQTRNGPVLALPAPVCITYLRPERRVLLCPARDANPFFHLMEALWCLDGRRDVTWPAYFNARIKEFSDDGETLNGSAYGWRWRGHFGYDQLAVIAEELRRNPNSRRCVLSMWDAMYSPYDDCEECADALGGADDLRNQQSKDLPCNTHAYFDCCDGRLNLTVCNRSNDALWGCWGTNAVQYSLLLEVMAAQVGVPMGVYRQFSNNLHVYTERYSELALEEMIAQAYVEDYHTAEHYSIVNASCSETWFEELRWFMEDPQGYSNTEQYEHRFFPEVAMPVYAAWEARKDKTSTGAPEAAFIKAPDWRAACEDWIRRREIKNA